MKKTILLSMISWLALVPAAQAQADDVVKVFNLDGVTPLATLLDEAEKEADSVVVSGPMSSDDMSALCSYCANGHVRGVDIRKVTFANDSLPAGAFGLTGIDNPVENISLPEHLRVIGPYAFYYMGNLKHVELPATLERICHNAFFSCLSLRNVSLPEGLREIQPRAFSSSGIEELTIPQSVTELRYGILANCYKLKTLNILANVDEVPSDMCLLCTNLENVVLPDDVKSIGSGAFDGAGLKAFQWPSALETIASDAFSDTQMEEVVLPPHVIEISSRAFSFSNALRSITLPASLLTIDQSALRSCPLLEAVYSMAVVPPLTTATGTEVPPQAVLYVPEGSVEAYQAATWWKDFKEIKSYVPTAISTIAADASGRKSAYTIGGVMAPQHYRGVVIKGGKKTIIK